MAYGKKTGKGFALSSYKIIDRSFWTDGFLTAKLISLHTMLKTMFAKQTGKITLI